MGEHSVLDAAGPWARLLEREWWLFVAVALVVYLLVMAFLVHGLRRRRTDPDRPASELHEVDQRLSWWVGSAVALTAVTLAVLATVDFVAARALASSPPDPLRISITGHQWWWEIEYEDPVASNRFRTANEFRIPVGRPVQLTLESQDVIHSFWVPSLQGKRDLIPGRTTTLTLQASRPAIYGGQCAEFCGHQHAYMRLSVHALAPAAYESWAENERGAARVPQTREAQRGQTVFLESTCVMCHSIQGTAASATVAPDLTHVGNRRTIAAGALTNTPAHLAEWISNPQHVKPGTNMPPTRLAPEDLDALVSYLASLK
jgi:cytochrome c oxidase subunit 2